MSGDRSEDDTIAEVLYSLFSEEDEKERLKILQQMEVYQLELEKHLEESRHETQQFQLQLQQDIDECLRKIKQIKLHAKQDEDPPRSTFGKAISFLQQAFLYPFRLLSSWREKLEGPVSHRIIEITTPTTSESNTMRLKYQPPAYSLHGSLHDQHYWIRVQVYCFP